MSASSNSIRLLDVHRDLDDVANLIEICFHDYLDSDGYLYISELRRAARQRSFIQFIPGADERVSMPIYGYVYENGKNVIGNLSLIPFMFRKKWIYLIANVAVHPDYQGQGIGKQLTRKALEHIQEHNVSAAWLQVRDDNLKAIHLYESLGFTERARRTNWISKDHAFTQAPPINGVTVSQYLNQLDTWNLQHTWLDETYPDEIAWYLSFNLNSFKPSFWRNAWNVLTGSGKEHWAAYQSRKLIGTASWEPTRRSTDTIWLASSRENDELAIHSLLPYISYHISTRRKLMVNYPADRGKEAFSESGFKKHNTLIWMKVNFETC